MTAIIQRIIMWLGARLHGVDRDQWNHILELVSRAQSMFTKGTDKMAWVKSELANYLKSQEGYDLLGKLTQSALNWLIETAVSFLKR